MVGFRNWQRQVSAAGCGTLANLGCILRGGADDDRLSLSTHRIKDTPEFRSYTVEHFSEDPAFGALWYWREVPGIRVPSGDEMEFESLDMTHDWNAEGMHGPVEYGIFQVVDNTDAGNGDSYLDFVCQEVVGFKYAKLEHVVGYGPNQPGGFVFAAHTDNDCPNLNSLGAYLSETYYWPGGVN